MVGAFEICALSGRKKIITYDMGGTSTDISLCDGKISFTTENTLGGAAIKVPMINISTIGAGGGSIAYIAEGGILKVGPRSAGADPGPGVLRKRRFADRNGREYSSWQNGSRLVSGR